MNRFIRLDTLEPVKPEPRELFWGPSCSAVTVKRGALSRQHKPDRVPYLAVSARLAVRLVVASLLEARLARIAYLMARDGNGCLYCGRDLTAETATVEHVVPKAHGGPDHASNLALSCGPCNAAAGHLSAAEKVRLAMGRKA